MNEQLLGSLGQLAMGIVEGAERLQQVASLFSFNAQQILKRLLVILLQLFLRNHPQ
ncbi:hypothetical protein D3C85_1801710 [compost metagenome]